MFWVKWRRMDKTKDCFSSFAKAINCSTMDLSHNFTNRWHVAAIFSKKFNLRQVGNTDKKLQHKRINQYLINSRS